MCRYVLQEDKRAQVLVMGAYAPTRPHGPGFSVSAGSADGPGRCRAARGAGLAPRGRAGPQPGGTVLRQAGRAYVERMGLENTQWALVQHFDRPHPYAHLVTNRVDNDGQTLPSALFCFGEDLR